MYISFSDVTEKNIEGGEIWLVTLQKRLKENGRGRRDMSVHGANIVKIIGSESLNNKDIHNKITPNQPYIMMEKTWSEWKGKLI